MERINRTEVILAAALAVVAWLFAPLLESLVVAALLAMATAPFYRTVCRRLERLAAATPWQRRLAVYIPPSAAAVVTGVLVMTVIAPFFYLGVYTLQSDFFSVGSFDEAAERIVRALGELPASMAFLESPLRKVVAVAQSHVNELSAWAAQAVTHAFTDLAGTAAQVVMMAVFFFFLSWYGKAIILFCLPRIPLERRLKRRILDTLMSTTAVVFYTLTGVMIAQGLAFGIFIAFFPGHDPLFLGFAAAVTSIVPVFGTALVWVPVALSELVAGSVANALLITVYSWAMMAFLIDNFVKLAILDIVNTTVNKGRARLNDFLIFFGLVAGLASIGVWGVVIGPALVALAMTLLEGYRPKR